MKRKNKMPIQYKIEDAEFQIQKMFERFDLENTQFAPGAYDFWITKEAPHASTLSVRMNTKSLMNEHKTNSATIVGVVSKKEAECEKLKKDYGCIKMTDTHFKPEGDFCYYHYYGEGVNREKMLSEIKQIMRDLIREHKRRKNNGSQ